MFEFDEFISFIQQTTSREIAGAYVCAKWPRNIQMHKSIIAEIGMQTLDVKIERLQNEYYQNKLFHLIRDWLERAKLHLRGENEFRTTLNDVANHIDAFHYVEGLTLDNLIQNDYDNNLLLEVWNWGSLIYNNGISEKLVGTTKLLHHIFPKIFVPVDRHYTGKFLNRCLQFKVGRANNLQYNNYMHFIESLKLFQSIKTSANDKFGIRATMRYADTSDTKAIDNWIIMFVDLELNNRQ
ncbi:MAG: hypothetical protein KF721_15100 [Ignavibacteriaceae bacterium]|nr:hypothetical protein [Ignavibacteriaceae bacterium]